MNFYCIYNEYVISSGSTPHHLCQFQEDREGNRSDIFPNARAIIEPHGNVFKVKTTLGDTLAVCMDIETVIKRINYAQKNVETVVNYRGKEMSLKQYEDETMPTLYRIVFTDGKYTGWIAAVDVVKKGKVSKMKLFYSGEDIRKYIEKQQKGDENYFTFGPRRLYVSLGGLERYEIPERYHKYDHLRDKLDEIRATKYSEHIEKKGKNADEKERAIELGDDGLIDVKQLYVQ